MKKKKLRGIDSLKSRYGLMFVSPWIIGFVLFCFLPLVQSLSYSFSEVLIGNDGGNKFLGLQHYMTILKEDPDYLNNLTEAVTSLLYSMPLILIVSLVLAIILNAKFKGRLFFRAIFFLPVIIASGLVLQYLSGNATSMSDNVSSTVTDNMFQVADIMNVLSLPAGIATYVQNIISNIFSLIWQAGVQTVLFISGLQSVPSSLYEASRVEGATRWEDFWFITFPSLSRVTLLVCVYTMIEQFTNATSPVIATAYTKMSIGDYDTSSAMLWFYFAVVGIIMGVVLFIYNRALMRKWQ